MRYKTLGYCKTCGAESVRGRNLCQRCVNAEQKVRRNAKKAIYRKARQKVEKYKKEYFAIKREYFWTHSKTKEKYITVMDYDPKNIITKEVLGME